MIGRLQTANATLSIDLPDARDMAVSMKTDQPVLLCKVGRRFLMRQNVMKLLRFVKGRMNEFTGFQISNQRQRLKPGRFVRRELLPGQRQRLSDHPAQIAFRIIRTE